MTRRRLIIAVGGLTALALATTFGADLQPAVVTDLTGTLQIHQPVPCGDDVERTTPVLGGRLELSPAEGVETTAGRRRFALVRANITFGGFSASRSCLGFGETRTYGDIHVQLARSASLTALPTATAGLFTVTIPKSEFEVLYTTIANGELERANKQPMEDVTGTIDLTNGTVTMRVVLGTHVRFRAGCVPYVGCVIDETHDGVVTANVAGTIRFPDTDGDGVADRSDSCRFVANPDQTPVATPTIAAPSDVTLASCLSRAFGFAAAADVCDGLPVTVTNNAPNRFDLGANVVTWRAQDAVSRLTTATQTVTIDDETPPTFTAVPPDVFLNDCGPANLGTPQATDDCAGDPTFTNDAPPKFFVGATAVTWTATDASGNTRTAIQTVHVVDTVAPVVDCVATRPPGSSFRVSAVDSCTSAPVIRLGTVVLANGETIMINETGQPGIRLLNVVGRERIRHFQVGRGEAVLQAADDAGNVASVACPVR